MLVLARTVTAAIAIGILGLAGSGAMTGHTDATSDQFEERWGDLNCDGAVQSSEAIFPLQVVAGGFGYVAVGICWPDRIDVFPETLLQIEGGPQVQWSDVDCNGKISSVDALWLLRFVVGLGVPEFAGCPEIGQLTTLSHVQPQLGAVAAQVAWELLWGDVNCSMTVNAVDGLRILRWVAGLRILQADVCYSPDALVQIEDGPEVQWSDADCNGTISSVDALRIYRYVAGFDIRTIGDCPDPGASVTIR